MPRMKKGRYALVGFLVSKLVLPAAKKRAKKKLRRGAVNTGKASARKVRDNPARTSLAVGSAAGAFAYLVKRRKGRRGAAPDGDE